MKKFIKLFTVLLFLGPLSDFALAYDAQIGDFYYSFNFVSNTATVEKPISSVRDAVVPELIQYQGQPYIVDSIAGECFRSENIRSVKLPNTIKGIGYWAFLNYYLSDIILPNSVRYVGTRIISEGIRYLEIGEGVTTIKNVGSYSNSSNENKTFKNNVTIVWNAISCPDFNVRKASSYSEYPGNYGENQLYDDNGNKLYDWQIGYYYFGETPFWQKGDQYVSETINKNSYRVSSEKYPSKYGKYFLWYKITNFEFGNSVEHIPAYLCFKLKSVYEITIPSSVKTIGENAFAQTNLEKVTLNGMTPPVGNGGLSKTIPIYVPCQAYDAYKASESWKNMNLQISPISYIEGPTTMQIIIGCDTTNDVISVGLEEGDMQDGNKLLITNLEPNSKYKDVPIRYVSSSNVTHNLLASFKTKNVKIETLDSKPVSNSVAILMATTNLSNLDESAGFEWKRNDAPEDMAPNKIYCPIANGQMAGRLKNLKDDVYYKYRAFYQSAAGNMYYGDWQYIFTGDVAVEFDPILYTYGATVVRENEATISGYALAGSEDFTEQGFEYWAETRANGGANAPHHMPAALNEHFFVQASGIALRATLTNLDAGTVYKYRVYGKVGDQYYYGSEQSFTTTGTYTPPTYTITFANWDGATLQSSQVEEGTLPEYTGATPERPEDEQYIYTFNGWRPAIVAATADATYTAQYVSKDKHEGLGEVPSDQVQCTKVLIDNHLYILQGAHIFDAQGKKVK